MPGAEINPGEIVADMEEEGLWLSVPCVESGTDIVMGIYLSESL